MPDTPSPPPAALGSRRPLVVVNPRAGHGRGGRDLSHLLSALRGGLGDVDVAMTARPGHAIELAAAAASERRPLVVAIGGDGTLNEVVNGLMQSQSPAGGPSPEPPQGAALPALGLIATGTGGDFGRALGIPHHPESYLAAVIGAQERAVDVGTAAFTGTDGRPARRYWINVLSAGVGGLVDRYTAAAPAFLGGRLAYAQATLRGIVMCRRVRLRCRSAAPDGRAEERIVHAHAIAICNGPVFGGGMNIAPMARPDDGLLEVIVFQTRTRWRLVGRLRTVYRGTHTQEPGVDHFTCRSIEITPAGAAAGRASVRPRAGLFPLDMDGDALGDVPLAVGLVRQAVRVRAPAE